MISMISSANFNNSDNKANFSSEPEKPETDDFAALLSGLSFVIPPVVTPPQTFSNVEQNLSDSQNVEIPVGEATQPLPQFDESIVLPENFARVLPKDIFSSLPEVTAENLISQSSIEADKTIVESDSAKTEVAVFRQKDFEKSGEKFEKIEAPQGEKNSRVENENFAQIENLEIEGSATGEGKTNFKFTENNLRSGNLLIAEKSASQNKLPKLFQEVSSFFEATDFASKTASQNVESVQKTPVESSNITTQIEPQLLQLAILAAKTEKPQILKMRLNPAELGAVEIKIEKDAAGKLNAHFNTEKEETRKILTENLPQLRDSLQDSGWQVERVEVSCSSFSFTGNEAREDSSRQTQNTAQNSSAQTADSDGSLNNKDETNSEKSNRLLSVRA